MAKRDIIVLGTSAGGVEALLNFARSIPQNLDASIFVVLHISPFTTSNLPQILSRACALPAVHARDGEKIERRKIYVAPPDHHLILEKGGRIAVSKGPKENRFRPSIDALFRSAALIYGPRAIGIVLSGLLDDGTSGMWNIKRNGGLAIVQDPEDALFPSMPQNVMQYVEVDHMLPAGGIGGLIAKLAAEKAPKRPERTKEEMELLQMEVVIATRDNAFEIGILEMGSLTTFACPECKGALVSIGEGKMIRFRCHTGHAYTSSTLLAGITVQVEEKLWEAMQGLEATDMLLRQIGDHYRSIGNTADAKLFNQKADEIAKRARVIHDSVFTQELMSEDIRFTRNGGKRSVNMRSGK
ncbi:MAG TPA: chemotaxis protein CheB [Flavisolibacter sp.]|jgi:two-component system chemotaxis response regulator CheB|nr:chemotaxis protein CheB [Flavisolibacter sp.]